MALRITADVFSGRPNPSFIVAGNEADHVVARVTQIAPEASAEAMRPALPRLGYRGLIVEQVGNQTSPEVPTVFRVNSRDLDNILFDTEIGRASCRERV